MATDEEVPSEVLEPDRELVERVLAENAERRAARLLTENPDAAHALVSNLVTEMNVYSGLMLEKRQYTVRELWEALFDSYLVRQFKSDEYQLLSTLALLVASAELGDYSLFPSLLGDD